VAGNDVAVATALGIGQYPDDGTQPDALLHRAVGLAASATAQGRAGHANAAEGGVAEAATTSDRRRAKAPPRCRDGATA
jgi:hypothetical protein